MRPDSDLAKMLETMQAAETVQVNLRQLKDETFVAEIRDRLARIREP